MCGFAVMGFYAERLERRFWHLTAQAFPTPYVHTRSNSSQACAQLIHLADILRLLHFPSHRPQIAIQRPFEKLEQHLEADARESWVVAAPVMPSVLGNNESSAVSVGIHWL